MCYLKISKWDKIPLHLDLYFESALRIRFDASLEYFDWSRTSLVISAVSSCSKYRYNRVREPIPSSFIGSSSSIGAPGFLLSSFTHSLSMTFTILWLSILLFLVPNWIFTTLLFCLLLYQSTMNQSVLFQPTLDSNSDPHSVFGTCSHHYST